MQCFSQTTYARGSSLRKVLTLLVTVVSIAWVVMLLADDWPEIKVALRKIDPVFLCAGALLTTLANYLVFEGFRLVASGTDLRSLSRAALGHFYFAAQLFKHLPGRIWGIGYQIANGREAGSTATWIFVNAGQMLLATYFALASSLVVLALTKSHLTGILVLASCIAGYFLAWAACSSSAVKSLSRRLPSRLHSLLTPTIDALADCPARTRGFILVVFVASWMCMYAAWGLFGQAHPTMSAQEGMYLLSLYMIAWFVGYITVLTPSGLGVRELVFVGLAQGSHADAIAYLALIGRLSLLASDLVLGLVFWPFAPKSRTDSGTP